MPDSDAVSAAQKLTLHGIHARAHLDVTSWDATVSALHGLRHLTLGWVDEEMLPALSALLGLSSLRLGVRHSMDSSLVCTGAPRRGCSAVSVEPRRCLDYVDRPSMCLRAS